MHDNWSALRASFVELLGSNMLTSLRLSHDLDDSGMHMHEYD